MAIGALLLWLFTAAAGIYLLATSNLRRNETAPPVPLPVPEPAGAVPSPQETKRAHREQFDPPSLVAARSAPVIPAGRALLEFAHPAFAITGLAFWLGFTLVHNRVLGWIAVGLVGATACAGLTWFTINARARKKDAAEKDAAEKDAAQKDRDEPAPSFSRRLVALHGAGAALTVILAVLSALVLHG